MTIGVEVPAVHVPVAVAEYWMLSTICSAGFGSHIPFTAKESAGVPVQFAFAKAESVGLPHAVDTEQVLHAPHDSEAPVSTVNGCTNGVDVGHAVAPAATMHAEKPAGGIPLQTASSLAVGTLQ